MRMLIIKDETDLQALSATLLDGRLGAEKSQSALASLQALNPHVDLNKLAAGAVLLVPDTSSFKTSASRSVAGGTLDGFEELVRGGLEATAAKFKAGNESRVVEGNELTAALKSPTLRHLTANDPELRQQLDDAAKQLKEREQQAADSEQAFQALNKETHAELAALAKLLE